MINPKNSIQIVICSVYDGHCGRSQSIMRFVYDYFYTEYDPTIEDYYFKEVTIDDMTILLTIYDTAGGDEYNNLDFCVIKQRFGLSNFRGVLFLYDITNRTTFDAITEYKSEIFDLQEKNISFLICGNKIDLEKQRQVKTCEGQQLADSLGVSFIEMSAKTGENINNAFFTLIRQIIEMSAKTGENINAFCIQKGPDNSKNHKRKNCYML